MEPVARQKNLQLITAGGAAMLLVCVCVNLYQVYRNVALYRESQRRAVRIAKMEAEMREWQQFLSELVEYSKRQPSIDSVLQKYMVKQSAPASKPR